MTSFGRTKPKLILTVCFLTTGVLIHDIPALALSPPHQPTFSFREGVISDGDIQVCTYGNGYARDVRLSPHGKQLMTQFPWAWRFNKKPYNVMSNVDEKCDVQGQGTDRLVLHFTSTEPEKRFAEERTVTLTYDAALDSYAFEIETCITVGDEPIPVPLNEIDVTDPLFYGLPGPACKGGPDMKWYNGCIYETPSGEIEYVPFNRLQSLKQELYVKKNGRFIMHGAPEGRPTIQMLGDTYQDCCFDICHAMYDLHLVHRVAEEGAGAKIDPNTPFQVKRTAKEKVLPAGSKYKTHYRVYQESQAEIDEMLARAKPRQPVDFERRDWSNMMAFFPEKTTFDTKLDLYSDFRRGEVDPWWWEPIDDESKLPELRSNLVDAHRPWSGDLKHCLWDQTVGHTDSYSVSMKRDEMGASVWAVQDFSTSGGWNFPNISHLKQLTITAYVKTKEVGGKGAFIVAYCPNGYESEKITGTQQWTKVTCVIPKQPDGRCVIQLRLEGTGQAWFDDVVVEEMKDRTE